MFNDNVEEIRREINGASFRIAITSCRSRALSELYQAIFLMLREEGYTLEQCYEGLIEFINSQPVAMKYTSRAETALREVAKHAEGKNSNRCCC